MTTWGVFKVGVAFVYYDKDEGGMREHQMDILFHCDESEAILAGIQWAINRRDAMLSLFSENTQEAERYKTPACIKVYRYEIGEPEENGYISTRITGQIFEWKYDTSPYKTVDDLLIACKAGELRPGRN